MLIEHLENGRQVLRLLHLLRQLVEGSTVAAIGGGRLVDVEPCGGGCLTSLELLTLSRLLLGSGTLVRVGELGKAYLVAAGLLLVLVAK